MMKLLVTSTVIMDERELQEYAERNSERVKLLSPEKFIEQLKKGDLSCIGIVKVKNTITDTVKYYIGVGKGENLEFDEDLIATSGAPFFPRMLEGI